MPPHRRMLWSLLAFGACGAFFYLANVLAADIRYPLARFCVGVSVLCFGAGVFLLSRRLCAITDRITLDIGYRYFQIANSTSTGVISYVPVPVGSEVIGSAFSASELFFAFRIYEPFRNWR
jgi:hypothetical protein